MDSEQLSKIFEAVKVLPLRPTDKIVLKAPMVLGREQRESLIALAEKVFAGHRVLVLEGGMDIEVLREAA